MLVRAAEGNVLLWKGAGRSSRGFFANATAFLTSLMGGKIPSSKNRSSISRDTFDSRAGLSHRLLPSRIVRAWRPIAFTPSSVFRLAIPCKVCRTISILPALKSKFSHCSASESSEEFSESSTLVAAVAANESCMKRKDELLEMLPLMYSSHDAA